MMRFRILMYEGLFRLQRHSESEDAWETAHKSCGGEFSAYWSRDEEYIKRARTFRSLESATQWLEKHVEYEKEQAILNTPTDRWQPVDHLAFQVGPRPQTDDEWLAALERERQEFESQCLQAAEEAKAGK